MSVREPVELIPGTVFEFEELADIHFFENGIGRALVSNMSPDERTAWNNREQLHGLLKPEEYYGRIGEITLEVMEEPYLRMLDSIERGLKFSRGVAHMISHQDNEYNHAHKEEFVGFLYSALAINSFRGPIGEIKSELWYFPTELTNARFSEREYKRFREANDNSPVIRRVAKAELDERKPKKAKQFGPRIRYEVGKYELHPPSVQ